MRNLPWPPQAVSCPRCLTSADSPPALPATAGPKCGLCHQSPVRDLAATGEIQLICPKGCRLSMPRIVTVPGGPGHHVCHRGARPVAAYEGRSTDFRDRCNKTMLSIS
jgi:hypothetical protein